MIKLAVVAGLGAGGYFIIVEQLKPEATVVRVERGEIVRSVSGSAMVRPEVDTFLLSPGSGFIKESVLKAGQEVERGQKLAEIDEGDLPFRIRAAELELRKVEQELAKESPEQIQLAAAREDLQLERALLAEGATTQAEVKELENRVEELQSTIETRRKELQTQRDILKNDIASLHDLRERLVIRAPFDGIITDVLAHPGDLMSRGFRVARIISLERSIHVEVNQEDIGILREGTRAKIRFFAYGGRLFNGRVTQILPGGNEDTQRFSVVVELTGADRPELRPGMTGETSFIAGRTDGAVVIPNRALYGRSVFVVNDDGKVEVREVQPGFVTYTQAEIVNGLNPGEYIILEDLDLFQDGDEVTVEDVTEAERLLNSGGA